MQGASLRGQGFSAALKSRIDTLQAQPQGSSMSGSLTGKTAFVSAAAQGIGRATALAFAAAGAQVIATDLNDTLLQQIASDRIRTARLDVLQPDAISQAAGDAAP